MLKAYFGTTIQKKKEYSRPELYPLGRATFLTHGTVIGAKRREKDIYGSETIWVGNSGNHNG